MTDSTAGAPGEAHGGAGGEVDGYPIGRLVSWTERPRHGNKAATSWRGRITEFNGQRARVEPISPCNGWAYPLIEELIDEETDRPLSLQPPSLPPPPAPGSRAKPRRKLVPIDWEDLLARLPPLPDRPEPRFRLPAPVPGPIASPSKPPCDRDSDNISQARAWLSRRAPAIEGQRGRPHTYATACALMFGFLLTEHDTLMPLSEWNVLCRPPWRPHELAAIVQYAAKHASKHEPGFMLRGRRKRKPRAARETRCTSPIEGMVFKFGDVEEGE